MNDSKSLTVVPGIVFISHDDGVAVLLEVLEVAVALLDVGLGLSWKPRTIPVTRLAAVKMLPPATNRGWFRRKILSHELGLLRPDTTSLSASKLKSSKLRAPFWASIIWGTSPVLKSLSSMPSSPEAREEASVIC